MRTDRTNGRRACRYRGDKHRRHRPSYEAVGRIPKEHFVSVHANPLRTQSPRHVAAHRRRQPLDDDQPDARGHRKGRGRWPAPRPRRRCGEAQPRTEGHEQNRYGGRDECTRENRRPGNCRHRRLRSRSGPCRHGPRGDSNSARRALLMKCRAHDALRCQCQISANRMMIGIGTPNSHNRIPRPMSSSKPPDRRGSFVDISMDCGGRGSLGASR